MEISTGTIQDTVIVVPITVVFISQLEYSEKYLHRWG